MIPRYTRAEMSRIWEPRNRFKKWLDIEILSCEAMAEFGEIPKDALKVIKEKAGFDIKRIDEIEKTVKHDVLAFLINLEERVGGLSRYIHKGLTSSDILDTSLALLMREAAEIIIKDIQELLEVLKTRAFEFKDTVMIGRSHGIHAEPITFGLKLALWYEEMERNLERMERAKERISYGKLSGAVGTYSNIDPRIEEYVCSRLGLKPAPVSSQVIQRDRHAEYHATLAIIASSIDKFATEIRHLQKTEVLEVEEPFEKGQKGSSAMPHKRNPIGSENLSGLARIVRANTLAVFENIPLWHERDISHSSVERVVIPDSTILIDFMLVRFKNIIKNLVVYSKNMIKNLRLTKGLIFSQRVLLELINKGLLREKAYQLVQSKAMEAWERGGDFKRLLHSNRDITKYLSKKEIDRCFDLRYYLRNVNKIFERVFRMRNLKTRRYE